MIYHVFQHGAEALRKIMEQVAKSGTVVGVVNHDPAECPGENDWLLYELWHDKTNKMSVHPAKTQISLGIHPVWSESSLCAQWIA